MTIPALPSNLFSDLSGTITGSYNPAGICISIMLTAALVCFLLSEITRNYSQVDKLWSIMPLIYSLVMLTSCSSARLLIMSSLVAVWGFRLSFNFYRKGGYNKVPWKGKEDYRWKIIQHYPELKGRVRFGLFNLLFISLYQHFLIFLFCAPLLIAAQSRNNNLTPLDLIAASLMLFFIILEGIADNQQYRFQKIKRQHVKQEGLFTESLKQGFLSEGLWRFVRHPNYTAEQGVWISFYLFGVPASGTWVNWTVAGSLLLVLLFIGSTALTERISSEKYPGYNEYKKSVPKYLPLPWRSFRH